MQRTLMQLHESWMALLPKLRNEAVMHKLFGWGSDTLIESLFQHKDLLPGIICAPADL